jgi:cytochrome P450
MTTIEAPLFGPRPEPESLARLQRITKFREAEEVTSSRDVVQGKFHSQELWPFHHRTVVALSGPEHGERRRVEAPLFRRDVLARFERSVTEPAVEREIAELERDEHGRAHGDLVPISHRFFLPASAAIVGLAVESRADFDRLAELLEIFEVGAVLAFRAGDTRRARQETVEAMEEFDRRFFRRELDHRRAVVAAGREGDLPFDLISALAVHMPEMADDMVLRESILFLNASSGTSTHSVLTTIHHLGRWLAEHPEDASLAAEPAFVQAAAFEAIRLHPVAGLLRRATSDIELSTGRKIAEGELVLIDLVHVNRDPEIFGPDGDRFDPYRRIDVNVRPWGMAFGAGSHMCLGRTMAVAQPSSEQGPAGEDAIGTVIRVCLALLRAGVELDPERPPVWRDGFMQERYSAFPVVFTSR